MESIIKALEKEQGIDVQRLDVMRDRAAQQLYLKLVEGNLRSATSSFPLLCEFCQRLACRLVFFVD